MTALRTVDRYVLGMVLVPFAACLGIGLALLVAERIVGVLNNTFGKGELFFAVFEMLAYLAPYNLSLAIPVAFYLSVLIGFNKMSRENGIDTFLACGVPLHRLALPVMVLSALLMAVSLVVIGWLQPYGRYAYRSVLFELDNLAVYAVVDQGVFKHADNRTFILDRIDTGASSFEHIFIYESEGPDKGSTVTTAQSGVLIPGTGDKAPVLRLDNGALLKIAGPVDPRPGSVLPAHESGAFAQAEIPLGSEQNRVFRPRGRDERELTLPELFWRQGDPPLGSSVNEMRAELHNRMVRILSLLLLPVLAIPFALGSSRNPPGARFAIAMLLLVAYHQLLDNGALLTGFQGVSPYLTLWLPFLLFGGFAVWSFWKAGFTVNRGAGRGPFAGLKLPALRRRAGAG